MRGKRCLNISLKSENFNTPKSHLIFSFFTLR
nr:MAG TPA: hypothetical protein [Caudoviricetes sp.]